MKDIGTRIQKLLGQQFDSEGYDVDLVPIPADGDRMVRIRTLEEALDEADGEGSYIIQLRPKPGARGGADGTGAVAAGAGMGGEESIFSRLVDETFAGASAGGTAAEGDEPPGGASAYPDGPRRPSLEGIYLSSGKVNIPYLQRNADLLYSTGEFALARNIYITILSSGERSGHAHFWIGRCLEAEGKLEEARKRYEESITYRPSLEAYRCLAELLTRLRRDHEAAETYDRALQLRDLRSEPRFALQKACADAWHRAGKPAEAERAYRKALELQPSDDEALTRLGMLQLQAGRVPDSRRSFEAALASNPKSGGALTGLGAALLAEGDRRGAHDAYARALEVDLNNPTAIYHLVKCAYELKTYATAARVVSEYVEIAPVNSNLLYSLAGLQYHLGRIEDAKATVARILELQPGHGGAAELAKLIEKY